MSFPQVSVDNVTILIAASTAMAGVLAFVFGPVDTGITSLWKRPSGNKAETGIYGTTSLSNTFSLGYALVSYRQYGHLARRDLGRLKSKVGSLKGRHKQLAQQLAYHKKLDKFKESLEINEILTSEIVELGLREFPPHSRSEEPSQYQDTGRVREVLKHFVRDWSVEGAKERDVLIKPLLEVLALVPSSKRSTTRVLVPGSGLGRLAWEVNQLGFSTTSCELSFYMNLALRFLLSPSTTNTALQHHVRPYCHWWSHQRSSQNTFRSVSFPDVVPRRSETWQILEQDFLSLSPSNSSKSSPGFDYIVTLYFIDTASNIISYLTHIHHLLKPGGTWVNLGPLLYHDAALELSLEELFQLCEMVGFIVEHESRRTIPSEYTADQNAMMRWEYQAEFWIARKRIL